MYDLYIDILVHVTVTVRYFTVNNSLLLSHVYMLYSNNIIYKTKNLKKGEGELIF